MQGGFRNDPIVPKQMFFTKGVGYHRNKLQALNQRFVMPASRSATLLRYRASSRRNVRLSLRPRGSRNSKQGKSPSLFLPRGDSGTKPSGFCIRRSCTTEKQEAIRLYQRTPWFWPDSQEGFDFAEDLAATMLASTLGIELDPDKDWNERKMVYQVGERQFVSRSTAQTARGHKDSLWTTVIACAVMLC